MNKNILMVLTMAFAALACNAAGSVPPARLEGRTFLSVEVTVNGAPRPLVAGTRVQLSFNDGNLGASAGCNHIGGAYRLDGGRLVTDSMAMTEMGCDPARHAQDEWLSSFLGSRPEVRLNGAELVLDGGGTVMRLLDREVAQPDRPLTGTRWQLTTIVAGDAAMSVPQDVMATLELSDDGNFSINAGCNQGGGRYARDGDRIEFSDIMLTRMACDAPRADVESAVLAVLESADLSLDLDADRLTLDAGDRGLVFSAAAG